VQEPQQIAAQLACRRITLVAIARERPEHDGVQRLGQTLAHP
jgi:hypothetical protein